MWPGFWLVKSNNVTEIIIRSRDTIYSIFLFCLHSICILWFLFSSFCAFLAFGKHLSHPVNNPRLWGPNTWHWQHKMKICLFTDKENDWAKRDKNRGHDHHTKEWWESRHSNLRFSIFTCEDNSKPKNWPNGGRPEKCADGGSPSFGWMSGSKGGSDLLWSIPAFPPHHVKMKQNKSKIKEFMYLDDLYWFVK